MSVDPDDISRLAIAEAGPRMWSTAPRFCRSHVPVWPLEQYAYFGSSRVPFIL
jgi:hypothetical protein